MFGRTARSKRKSSPSAWPTLGHPADHLLRPFHPAELAGVDVEDRLGLPARRVRVELERSEHDVDGGELRIVSERRQGAIEATLADVAPRADEVGEHLDGDRPIHRLDARPNRCDQVAMGSSSDVSSVGDMNPADVQATFCATLVDEWVHHGVSHAVVAPGSRSTPMALALAGRAELGVHVVHDERAAAFVALGLGLGGTPAVLLCTSGTAAANFHPAVVEAGLSNVPMIVVTADRPPELRDVGAAQTVDQNGLYGGAVRWYHDPGIADGAASASWRSLGRRCFAAAATGPVHLNLPFREPFLGEVGELPPRHSAPAGSSDRCRQLRTLLRTC